MPLVGCLQMGAAEATTRHETRRRMEEVSARLTAVRMVYRSESRLMRPP